jgi:hypothetical protein
MDATELTRLGERFGHIALDKETARIFIRSSDPDTFAGVEGVSVTVPRTPPHAPLSVIFGVSASSGAALPDPLIRGLNLILAHPRNAGLPLRRRLLFLENNLSSILRELSALQSEALVLSDSAYAAGGSISKPLISSGVEHPPSPRFALAEAEPLAPPAKADAWCELFTTTWTLEEQQALENALHEPRKIREASFWDAVSREHLRDSKSPEQCLARYLLVQVRHSVQVNFQD